MGTYGLTAVGTGSGTGLDIQALVDQVIYAERAPARRMEAEQQTLTFQASTYRDINAKLLDLKARIATLKDASGVFNSKAVTSSNTSVLTASATTSAVVANHILVVSGLATTSSYYSDQLASSSTTFATGTFDLKVGTADAVTITVDDTRATLDDLVAHLNNDFEVQTATGTLALTGSVAENETVVVGSTTYTFKTVVSGANDVLLGATAADSLANLKAAINFEAGEGTTYGTGTVANTDATATAATDTTLTIEALTAGASGNSLATTVTLANGSFGAATLEDGQDDLGITASVITDAGGARLAMVSDDSGAPGDLTISGNTTGLLFTKGATGTNAELTVDGVPVSSASNTVTGVLPGVTLTLLSTSASQVSLSVGGDTVAARTALESFVASYNSVTNAINAQFTYNSVTQSAGTLAGDISLRIVQQQLLSDIAYAISGNDGFTSLASIGVDLNNDGTLAIDGTELDAALASHSTDVQNLFQSLSPAGFAQNLYTNLGNLTDSVSGPLNAALEGATQSQASIAASILDFEGRLETRRQELVAQYSQIDIILRQIPLMLAQIESQLGALTWE